MQSATPVSAPPRSYGRFEILMRRALRIPDQAPTMTAAEAERSFSFALLVSATRCIVGYGILPIALPLLSLAPGIEPWIDIPIGLVAICFDVRGMRRFWLSNHPRRKAATVLYALVIVFVIVLLVRDFMTLLG